MQWIPCTHINEHKVWPLNRHNPKDMSFLRILLIHIQLSFRPLPVTLFASLLQAQEMAISTKLHPPAALRKLTVKNYGFTAALEGKFKILISFCFPFLLDFFDRTFTFWRFLIQIPLDQHEMAVHYSINNGQQLEFCVPGRNQNMRWAAHSVRGLPVP